MITICIFLFIYIYLFISTKGYNKEKNEFSENDEVTSIGL